METNTLRKLYLFGVLIASIFGCVLAGPAQAQNLPEAAILWSGLNSLSKAERERKLIEGAKKEGKVVWYTVDSPKTNQLLSNAFRKKYPFIEVQFIRAKSRAIADRIITEARSGRYMFDLATTSSETFGLYPADIFAHYNSPAKDRIPESMKADRWASLFTFIRAIGYNTDMVKEQDVPKTWEDLLDARWKGKILFDESSLPEVSALYGRWGKEKTAAYLEKLGQSGNLQLQRGRNVMAQLLTAGEAPLAVTVYAYEIEGLKKKGAPVEWAMLDITPGMLQLTSIGRYAPNPYSAALLYDFLLDQDGQKVFAEMSRVPANPDVKSIARMDAAVSDRRLVLDAPETGAIGKDLLKLLDEKILKPGFEKKK